MIRKAIIVVLSLAAVATGVSALASFFSPVIARLSAGAWCFRSGLSRGLLLMEYDGRSQAIKPNPQRPYQRYAETRFDFAGFAFENYVQERNAWRYWRLSVPLWIPVTVFAMCPLFVIVRGPLRRRRRRKRGLCVGCGYDLTGNVSGVCPECATEIEQP